MSLRSSSGLHGPLFTFVLSQQGALPFPIILNFLRWWWWRRREICRRGLSFWVFSEKLAEDCFIYYVSAYSSLSKASDKREEGKVFKIWSHTSQACAIYRGMSSQDYVFVFILFFLFDLLKSPWFYICCIVFVFLFFFWEARYWKSICK